MTHGFICSDGLQPVWSWFAQLISFPRKVNGAWTATDHKPIALITVPIHVAVVSLWGGSHATTCDPRLIYTSRIGAVCRCGCQHTEILVFVPQLGHSIMRGLRR